MDPGSANIELWFRCCFLASVSEKLSKSSTSPKQQGKNSDPNLNSEKKNLPEEDKKWPKCSRYWPSGKSVPKFDASFALLYFYFPTQYFLPDLNIPCEMSNIWIYLDFKSLWAWWPTVKLEELEPASSSLSGRNV